MIDSQNQNAVRDAKRGFVTLALRNSPLVQVASSRWNLIQVALLASAVLWVYWPSLRGDWLWDDNPYITNNTLLRSVAGLKSIWFSPRSTLVYYPIEETVQWLQWHLWGRSTLPYHLTNIVLHFLGSLLVWRLLGKFGLRLAWLGGLLFAIHPIQVESVAWISELKNTLSLPPLLLAYCAYIDYEKEGRRSRYWLALLFFSVSLLCKLSGVFFPLLILLYGWWKRGVIGWRDVKDSLPFFIIAGAIGSITMLTGVWDRQFNHVPADYFPAGGLLGRFVLIGLATCFYISKIFLPVNFMAVYPMWPVNYLSPLDYLPWVAFGAVLFWMWQRRKSWGRHAILGLGFFLINLAPTPAILVAPNNGGTWVMDHFTYLSVIGLIGLVVAGGETLAVLLPSIAFSGSGLLAVLLLWMAFQSREYARVYITPMAFWSYTLQHNPQAWPAYNNLGIALLQEGHAAEAIPQFERTLSITSDYADVVHGNLGSAFAQTGHWPQAIEQDHEALRINPDYAEARKDLGLALLESGRGPEAIIELRKALDVSADGAEVVHYNLGRALLQSGQPWEAIAQYEAAIQIRSNYPEAYCGLGYALMKLDRAPDAAREYQNALKIQPDNAEAHNNLGNTFSIMGRVQDAIAQFTLAVGLQPDFAEAYYNWGNALVRANRNLEAIVQFKQAVKIKPGFAEAHSNMGIAFMRTGDFQKAVDEFNQALRIEPDFNLARINLAKAESFKNSGLVPK